MKERLFKLRKEILNLSRRKFGEPIGMTDSEIKNIETGMTTLKDNKIRLICSMYNVNETWLRTGEGEIFVQLQRVDEISDFFKRVLNADMSDEGEASLQAFITALARLSPEQLTSAAKLIDTFIESYTDAKKEGQE